MIHFLSLRSECGLKEEGNAAMWRASSSIIHNIRKAIALFYTMLSRSHLNITIIFGLSISKALSIKWSNYFKEINRIKI